MDSSSGLDCEVPVFLESAKLRWMWTIVFRNPLSDGKISQSRIMARALATLLATLLAILTF